MSWAKYGARSRLTTSFVRSRSTTGSAPTTSSRRMGKAPHAVMNWSPVGSVIPHKAILGTAYELATGHRLRPGDFEGGKAGAVAVLENLGFDVEAKG